MRRCTHMALGCTMHSAPPRALLQHCAHTRARILKHLVTAKCVLNIIYLSYRLHPLVGKSFRRPIAVTQIRADLRRQQKKHR